MSIDIGIPAKGRQEITAGLSRLLADSYTLYLKTHNYHWNVTGPHFNTLHTMFEGQYTEDSRGPSTRSRSGSALSATTRRARTNRSLR